MSFENEDNSAIKIMLGRRKSDVLILMDWNRTRGIVKCNIAYIGGNIIFLEDVPTRLIPSGPNQNDPTLTNFAKIQMGIVLISRRWGSNYFALNEHDNWNESDYFSHAAELIHQRKRSGEDFDFPEFE